MVPKSHFLRQLPPGGSYMRRIAALGGQRPPPFINPVNNNLSSVSSPGIVHPFLQKLKQKGVKTVKQDEKQPIPWEAKDPKPPVVHSGHLDGRKH